MSPLSRYRLAALLAYVGAAVAVGAAVLPASAAGAVQAASPGELDRWPVPYGYVRDQKGAAVALKEVTPSASAMCGAAIVENGANVAVAAIRFAAFAMPRRGSHEPRPEAMRVSDWLTVGLEPGATASVDVELMSADEVHRIAGPYPQVMCALTEIRYANGALWRSSPLVVFAPTHPEIPRALIGAPAPADTPFCKDAEGDDYSHGAIVRVALEPGTVARCDNGRWIEGRPLIGAPARAR